MVDAIIKSESKEADVLLIKANYDKTSSFGKGADKAPDKIVSLIDSHIEVYDRQTKQDTSENIKISSFDLGDLNKLSPEEMVKKIKNFYSSLSSSTFPILIGGEHSVTNGALEFISQKEKPSDITIVQLDAHLDLREDDSDYNSKPYGKYAHACVMRRAHELGFNLVQVGVRAFSRQEFEFAKSQKNITIFEWPSSTKDGKFNPFSLNEILKSIKTNKVYLTIDIDGFDPSIMPETGTPVPGGFDWIYGNSLINKIIKEKKVIALDVVEVAPKEKESPTAYSAAQLIYNIIGQLTIR
jgi:agmatinase